MPYKIFNYKFLRTVARVVAFVILYDYMNLIYTETQNRLEVKDDFIISRRNKYIPPTLARLCIQINILQRVSKIEISCKSKMSYIEEMLFFVSSVSIHIILKSRQTGIELCRM